MAIRVPESINEVLIALQKEHKMKMSPSPIGDGAQCVVYKGEYCENECAVRISRRSREAVDYGDEADREEMIVEIFGRPGMRHPNLVSPLPAAWQLSKPVIYGHYVSLWEFCPGGTMFELMRKSANGLPVNDVLPIVIDIAKALDYMREKGVLHRDVKPENILSDHGLWKLADLGMAKFVGASTALHSGCGTLPYMPLELVLAAPRSGQPPGQAKCETVDVFALAATYFEVRTGSLPFGRTVGEIIHNQRAGQIDASRLDDWERVVVTRALSKYPKLRPDTAGEWVKQLISARRNAARGNDGRLESAEILSKKQYYYGSMLEDEEEDVKKAERQLIEAHQKVEKYRQAQMRVRCKECVAKQDWQQLYEVADSILKARPNDREASKWLREAVRNYVPDSKFQPIREWLQNERDAILQKRRLTTRGRLGLLGIAWMLVTACSAVLLATRGTNTGEAAALAISVAAVLAVGLMGLTLGLFLPRALWVEKFWGLLGCGLMVAKPVDYINSAGLPAGLVVALSVLTLVFLTGLVLAIDRWREAWIDSPTTDASRKERREVISRLESRLEKDLMCGHLVYRLRQEVQELWAFYEDVWPELNQRTYRP